MINFRTAIQRLLPPQACLSCRIPVYRKLPLCQDCESELPWQPPGCLQCGVFNDSVTPGARCDSCQHTPPAFNQCFGLFAYEQPVTDMIRRFKDHSSFSSGRCLSHLLLSSFRQHYFEHNEQPAYLIPVPLHRRRLCFRGFNQSLWMARAIHQATGVPLLTRACKRLNGQHTQRGLGARQRALNIYGMFQADRDADLTAGQHIAIIDDVVTTTATANAMSQVLRQHGAGRIDVWALARVN